VNPAKAIWFRVSPKKSSDFTRLRCGLYCQGLTAACKKASQTEADYSPSAGRWQVQDL
jgi:hypothetical protein